MAERRRGDGGREREERGSEGEKAAAAADDPLFPPLPFLSFSLSLPTVPIPSSPLVRAPGLHFLFGGAFTVHCCFWYLHRERETVQKAVFFF